MAEQQRPAAAARAPDAPSRVLLAAYAAPALGIGTLFFLNAMFLMKFATEVLRVAPALVGTFYLVARVWDGVSDPIVGHLSDRTHTRLGRRRPWLAASVVPIVAAVFMLWAPPERLEGALLEVWLGAAIIGFYTATTIFWVPYQSFGAEISRDPHETTRVFGALTVLQMCGTLIAAVAGTWMLFRADDPREAARSVALGLSLMTAAAVLTTVVRVPERPDHAGRGARSLRQGFVDVWRNPHARVLYAATLIDNLGGAALGALAPFYADYVLGAGEHTDIFLIFYMLPGIAMVPVLIRLSRRFGKVRSWRWALVAQSLGFLCMGTLGQGDFALACAFVAIISIGSVAGQVLAPSVQSDVIDWDELHSGERKEGAYFAVRNFFYKASFGIGGAAVGFMLQMTGFDPDEVPGEGTILGMRILMAGTPAAGALLGAAVLGAFRLDALEHGRVVAALDARRAAAPGAAGGSD